MFDDRTWNVKYILRWCYQCDSASIVCPKCNLSSCSCGSCVECHEDFIAFNGLKTSVYEYLAENEQEIYNKGLLLRNLIVESLASGDAEINWNKLKASGNFSKHSQEIFRDNFTT